MVALHPSCDCIEIRVVINICTGLRIAEDRMLRSLDDGILDIGTGLKVHVRDPQRQDIGRHASSYGKIVFQAVCVSSFDDLVKIQIPFRHFLFLLSRFFIGRHDSRIRNHPSFLYSGKSTFQVCYQILCIFDTRRETERARCDAVF